MIAKNHADTGWTGIGATDTVPVGWVLKVTVSTLVPGGGFRGETDVVGVVVVVVTLVVGVVVEVLGVVELEVVVGDVVGVVDVVVGVVVGIVGFVVGIVVEVEVEVEVGDVVGWVFVPDVELVPLTLGVVAMPEPPDVAPLAVVLTTVVSIVTE